MNNLNGFLEILSTVSLWVNIEKNGNHKRFRRAWKMIVIMMCVFIYIFNLLSMKNCIPLWVDQILRRMTLDTTLGDPIGAISRIAKKVTIPKTKYRRPYLKGRKGSSFNHSFSGGFHLTLQDAFQPLPKLGIFGACPSFVNGYAWWSKGYSVTR